MLGASAEGKMSVSGIMGTSFYQQSTIQNSFQQRRAEFQQLGQDLQSGNLTAAQQDFTELTATSAAVSSSGTATTGTTATGSSSSMSSASPYASLAQDFSTLGQAIQSGNLSAAQLAYLAMQQDAQSVAQTTQSSQSGANGSSSGSSTSDSSSSSTTSGNSNLANMLASAVGLFSAVA
jgi:hypothetical protein